MRQLLAKDAPFVWSKECHIELDYLKQCLTEQPVLKPFNLNQYVLPMTDASQTGYGYCTLQLDESDNKLHPISYGAQALTKAQSKHTAAELKLESLALALKHIQYFAIHKRITILTDNTRVLHVDRWHPVNARQRRLIAFFMQFNLHVKQGRRLRGDEGDMSPQYFDRGRQHASCPPKITEKSMI